MKHKKIIVISAIIIILVLIGSGIIFFLNKQDDESTLTILDKQWIENNKNKVIDLSILNGVPVFNDNGEGVFFDFIKDLEKQTKLEFNKVSYKYKEANKAEYSFKVDKKLNNKDILIYEDNFALISTKKDYYTSSKQIKDLVIGVTNDNLKDASLYLKDATNLAYKTFEDEEKILEALEKNEIDSLILPKNLFLKSIIENKKLNIIYNIADFKLYYTLTLGKEQKLNQILNKYYKKWSGENYLDSYNKHFSNSYFDLSKIDEKEKVKFRSKRYVYGFVDNSPYDTVNGTKLLGLNQALMKKFTGISDVEISYKKYKDTKSLVEAFNTNKIDFFFDNTNNDKYDTDIYNLVLPYSENIVVLSSKNTNANIDSIYSLTNKNILTPANSKISSYLKNADIKFNEYTSMNKLFDNIKDDSLIIIDEHTYLHAMYNELKQYKIEYQFNLGKNYSLISRDIKNNEVFNEYFDFYLSFINSQSIMNNTYNELSKINNTPYLFSVLFIASTALILIILGIFGFKKIEKNKNDKKFNISKEDKLKYVDMLTSLKNRNYLNDNIEKWDESDIYPQTIIIIDLNNIAYVNDNYGHEEGDKVIKQASNILFKNQIANSDIIRTNGNEFLIYLVEYDEKQVVSYIRKLNKEFKELEHGFGAAMGYSVITDAIKTIDDAVNEATLDMRNNKEEANY